MEDHEIVVLYQKKEEQAIKETSQKYGRRLHSIAKHILENECDAEECENDTYYEAWNLIPPHDPSAYLFAFLARIIRHKSLNLCKHNNTKKRSANVVELTKEMEECIANPTDEPCKIPEETLAVAINTFLRSLGDESRNVFLRRYYFADEVREIGERFGMSDSKVKSMLFRTRNKLKVYLIKEGYDL